MGYYSGSHSSCTPHPISNVHKNSNGTTHCTQLNVEWYNFLRPFSGLRIVFPLALYFWTAHCNSHEIRQELPLNKSQSQKEIHFLLKDLNLTFSDRQYSILLGIIPSVSSANMEDIAPLCLIQRRQILLKFNFSLLHPIIFIHNPAYNAVNFHTAGFWYCVMHSVKYLTHTHTHTHTHTLTSDNLCAQNSEVGNPPVWLLGVLVSEKFRHMRATLKARASKQNEDTWIPANLTPAACKF